MFVCVCMFVCDMCAVEGQIRAKIPLEQDL